MQFRPGNDMTRQRGVVIGPEAAEVLSFPNHSEEATVTCFSHPQCSEYTCKS